MQAAFQASQPQFRQLHPAALWGQEFLGRGRSFINGNGKGWSQMVKVQGHENKVWTCALKQSKFALTRAT